jgi:hypothetical protein
MTVIGSSMNADGILTSFPDFVMFADTAEIVTDPNTPMPQFITNLPTN